MILTCTNCVIKSNSVFRFPIGGVAKAIQLSIQTPAYATASGASITDMSTTSRYETLNLYTDYRIVRMYHFTFVLVLTFLNFNSIVFTANSSQVFSGVAAFSMLYFPALLTSDAGVAYTSSLIRIVCQTPRMCLCCRHKIAKIKIFVIFKKFKIRKIRNF